MAVPIGFIRNKNPNLNLRGALKIDAIFATDDAVGTEAFRGWLADNNVVTSFNDALIGNKIGVVDTDGFNISLSNRFAYTSMSEGQKIVTKELILVKFQNAIDPNYSILPLNPATFNKGDLIEFTSNGVPFGSTVGPSNGKSYKIHGLVREKTISLSSASFVQNSPSNFTVTVVVDPKENLTEYSPSTSTGNNYQNGDTVVISGVAPAAYNGTYQIFNVTSTGFSYTLTSSPGTYQYGGKVFKTTNELLLTEVNRATASPVTYASGTNTINLSTATVNGRILEGQFIRSTGPGISTSNVVTGYSAATKILTLLNPTTAAATNVTLTFEIDATNDVVVPTGALVPDVRASDGGRQPAPFLGTKIGAVVESYAIKSPINYYIYGDARLKYFWSYYDSSSLYNGWEQNVTLDGFNTLYNNCNPAQGTTPQLIGDSIVFNTEDTFNNVVKTLGVDRGTGVGFNDDYTPQGRSALLYISATDSQGNTGATQGKSRGSSTSAYSVSDAITAVKNNRGYWIGVIGGSFLGGCQNEIQTFRKDTTDGIAGDPRGFTPIVGEVTSIRVGVPINTVSYNSTTQKVTCTTFYDHKFGNVNATLRIRIKNAPRALALEGLRDITVTGAKTFEITQLFPTNPVTSAKVEFDDYGYALNITSLLTVPTGFYRKSTLKYVNSLSTLNDTRILANPPAPGGGLDRKNILTTIQITETTGTLQYFSSYPVGDFFIGMPESLGGGTNYFAYPGDGRDIKFKVNVTNQGTLEYIQTSILDAGSDEVTPREEFFTVLYPTEFTATVTAQTGNTITVNNVQIFNNGGEGRDFTQLNTGGSTYRNSLNEATFAATNVSTTNTTGTGTGLTFNIQVISGVITSIKINNRGSGYSPGNTGVINAPTGGSVVTKATYTITGLRDDQYVEISFDGAGSSENRFANLTNVDSVTSLGGGSYSVVLNKTPKLNTVGKSVSFTYPNDNRRVNVYVKPSNNFKDISVTAEAIAADPTLSSSDAYITFAGYGYTKQDVLTPSEVTNTPATITNALYTKDTKIALDGFLVDGQSVSGTTSFTVSSLNGNFSGGGVGAAFLVKQTVGGTYNVSIIDQGSNFSVTEEILIPGYNLGGAKSAKSINITNTGSGYANGTYTNIATTTSLGSGLTLNFTVSGGQIVPSSVQIASGGSNIEIGTTGQITGLPRTVVATFTVTNTVNDLTITVTKIDDNSRVTLTTLNNHNFVPPLGRTTVDILVQGVVSTLTTGSGFNGRFVAEVADSKTLTYNIPNNPGNYVTGGTVYNVSVDVVNDTFASFSNKLFFNINKVTNNPTYPYIRFVSNATYDGVAVTITTLTPHGLVAGQEIRVSGLVTTRNSDWNLGKAVVNSGATLTANTFSYNKTIGGNPGVYVNGGEVTNPYVKVLGGIYTKDFNRIIFVNTKNTPQDGIDSDKTKDFLVRDINFRQVSNDGFDVKDGAKHNFYILDSNTLAIPRRIVNISSITYIPATLEYEVTTSSPHGLWEDNEVIIAVTAGTPSSGTFVATQFNTPNNTTDVVTRKVSDTVFRYTVFRIGRDFATTPVNLTAVTGTVTKRVNISDGYTLTGPTNAGNARDIIKFSGLTGAPGISNEKYYFVVSLSETNIGGQASYLSLRISNTKNGAPISFALDISSATYNRSLEKAIIQVPGTTPHNLLLTNQVNVGGVSSQAYNGLQTITDIISPTIFAYSLPAAQGTPDTTNQSITKTVIIGDPGSTEVKRVNAATTSPTALVIRSSGQNSSADNVAIGMLVVGIGSQAAAAIPANTYVTGWNPSTRTISISKNITANITANNATADIELRANVAGCSALAFHGTSGTYPALQQVGVGQLVTGTGLTTGTRITALYQTTQDSPTETTNLYYIATLSLPLTTTLTNLGTVVVRDNLATGRSIRLTNFTGTPYVGSEIVNVDALNNTISTFETGTTITSFKTYTIGATTGYIIETSNNLLNNLTTGTVKVYPNTNAGAGGTVTGKVATITSNVINNQDTDFRGQTQLTADISGWDHVSLAKETGGALFFQLGFVKTCTGAFGASTITATNTTDIPTGTGAAGYGVYGEGIAPGATIVSISGNVITLSNPNIGAVSGFVGFARPNSVSIFPKYTQEFGRILGKTFAEWLFKIA